ncbi:hypothetical protein MLD38_007960 [Melastoma candidum]|uniref:Uncharacterized protein n=1 Tax=Melastoma candidum TaxID=119954 RepID=A0ACB9RS86_9MYRT|nr:hypothetical protein MLD38_007960 [Melastoma candidum]
MPLPLCAIPNCTTDLQCGGTTPPLPPSTLTALQALNLTDRQCVPDKAGRNHNCKCNEESNNALGQRALPCFKRCSVNGDCEGVLFGRPKPQLPPPSNSAPPKPREVN